MDHTKDFYESNEYLKKMLRLQIEKLKDSISNITLGMFKVYSSKDYSEYYSSFKKVILFDVQEYGYSQEQIIDSSFDLMEIEYDEKDIELLYLLITVHVLYRIKKMSIYTHETVESMDQLMKYYHDNNSGKYWFRGQSLFEWKLIPSYYRSLEKKDTIIHYEYLKNDYSEMGITKKLKSVFGNYDLDYEKLSFVQHSLAITPLLDFTKNILSAASFACGNHESSRNLYEKDASIYLLNVEENNVIRNVDEATRIIRDLNVEHIGSRPRIATLIKSKFWQQFVRGKLHSEYYLIDIKTNDRMRIQEGTFVLFNKVLFIGDDLVISPKSHKELSRMIKKLRIKSKYRVQIYKEIMKEESKHHLQKMMNPYEYMVE